MSLVTLSMCLVQVGGECSLVSSPQAANPLLLEVTVELCYPASEILSGGWIFLG